NCDEPTGSAKVSIKNNVLAKEVYWSDGLSDFYGNEIHNKPYGTYKVTVISTEECETKQDVIINPDLMIYNGLSPNGDGMNDKFRIGCIEMYERNNVKLFNRGGNIVFEADY